MSTILYHKGYGKEPDIFKGSGVCWALMRLKANMSIFVAFQHSVPKERANKRMLKTRHYRRHCEADTFMKKLSSACAVKSQSRHLQYHMLASLTTTLYKKI